MQRITLETLGGGILVELFEHELAKILADIDNPNTPAAAVRGLTLNLTLKPTEDRAACQVLITSKAKLGGTRPASGMVYLGRQGGRLVALGADPRQLSIPMERPALVEKGPADASR